jgi:hypothetical protein
VIREGRDNCPIGNVVGEGASWHGFGEHARLNFPDGIDDWLERAAA